MKILYCPWRSDYTNEVNEGKKEGACANDCIFCKQFAKNTDDAHFILKRFKHHAVMLNRYPYNAGHLLILPFNHVANLLDLSPEARAELTEIIAHSIPILKEQLGAHGFNVGLNLGKAGGAGIPAHLHYHILPRFFGDTNFLPTLTQTKQISFDLNKMFEQLKPAFDSLTI